MQTFEVERRRMVEEQLVPHGVCDPRVLEAMGAVPRERFLPPAFAPWAYEDQAFPIAERATISQPLMLATMLESARLSRGDRALDVGTGSGYAAAVLSRLVRDVHSVERRPELSARAAATLHELSYDNVTCVVGDGTVGLRKVAPFDAIIAYASSRTAPPQLLDQLAMGGRLVIPIGGDSEQTLTRIVRLGRNRFAVTRLAAVCFAPLEHARADRPGGSVA